MTGSAPLTSGERQIRFFLWVAVAVALPIVVYLRISTPPEDPYAWAPVDQQAFADANRSRPLDLGAVAPGQTVWMVVRVRNVGVADWSGTGAAAVRLGTAQPRDRASTVATPAWLSGNRPTAVREETVPPDGIGTFEFPITVPAAGPFDERFDLVAEGRGWFRSASPLRLSGLVAAPGEAGAPPG